MNHVSIFEKKWLDVIFEGKNQQYGAYQLRRENEKTTWLAFIFGLSLLTFGIFLLSSFHTKPTPDNNLPPIISDTLVLTKVEIKKEVHKGESTQAKTTENAVKKYTPVAPEFVPIEPVPEPKDPVLNPNPGLGSATGTSTDPLANGGDPNGTSTQPTSGGDSGNAIDPNAIENAVGLDEQPEFPGGINRFYEEIKRRFDPQALEETDQVHKVFVTFVIEKNGTMTDIQILRNADESVDKEALRVLHAIKAKWRPGQKKGQAVRSRFTIPITVSQ